MRALPRRILIAAAVAVALLIGLLAALPRLLDLESLRRRILASAEAALHRKVEAGAIRLQIFSGLGAGLENLVVRNPPGWESPDLLTAKRISVKVAFLPLLSRRVEVKRIVLDAPALTVERAPTGALSVDDLMRPAPDGAQENPPAAAGAALLVSRLVLERGAVRFVDRKVAPGKTVTTALEDVTGVIADVGGAAPARFDLAGRMLAGSGSNLSLRGTFGPPKPGAPMGEAPLAATFSARGLELARLAPYTGGTSDAGVLTLDGKAEGAPLGVLRVTGAAQLTPRGTNAVPGRSFRRGRCGARRSFRRGRDAAAVGCEIRRHARLAERHARHRPLAALRREAAPDARGPLRGAPRRGQGARERPRADRGRRRHRRGHRDRRDGSLASGRRPPGGSRAARRLRRGPVRRPGDEGRDRRRATLGRGERAHPCSRRRRSTRRWRLRPARRSPDA
jgi:hypothetical protein